VTYRHLEGATRDSKAFWNLYARMSSSAPAMLPDMLLEDGTIVSDGPLLREKWADHFRAQGTPNTPTTREAESFQNAVRILIERFHTAHPRNVKTDSSLIALVSTDEVDTALKRIARRKAPGPDGLPIDFFKDGGPRMLSALCFLMNSVLDLETWPSNWSRGSVFPLHKGKGSLSDPSNYRGISLVSVVSKIFEVILNRRVSHCLESNGILSDFQAGFRDERSTLDQIFILNECIAQARELKRPLYIAFLDVEKAYDKTWRDGVVFRFIEAGYPAELVRLMQSSFASVRRSVIVNQQLSEEFPVNGGVVTGAVLSPGQYDVFIDAVTRELVKGGFGITIAGRIIPALLYADDKALLASSTRQMQRTLSTVSSFATRNLYRFNNDKSGVVVIGNDGERKAAAKFPFELGGQRLAVIDLYKYLGAEMGNPTGGKWSALVKRCVDAATVSASLLASLCSHKWGVTPNVQAMLFKSLVLPRLEYAAPLWSQEISQALVHALESVQIGFARRSLGCGHAASNVFVRGELGLRTVMSHLDELTLRHFDRLCSTPNPILRDVFRERLRLADAGLAKHSWAVGARRLFEKYRLLDVWRARSTDMKASEWKLKCRDITMERDVRLWREEVSSMARLLPLYAYIKDAPSPERYLSDFVNSEGRWLKTQLRAGVLHIGEYLQLICRLPPARARCRMCRLEAVEDSLHFVWQCTAYADMRLTLLATLRDRLTPLDCDSVVDYIERHATDSEALAILAGDTMRHHMLHDRLALAAVAKVIDRTFRNFLLLAWRRRGNICGRTVLLSTRPPSFREIPFDRHWAQTHYQQGRHHKGVSH